MQILSMVLIPAANIISKYCTLYVSWWQQITLVLLLSKGIFFDQVLEIHSWTTKYIEGADIVKDQ